MEIGKQLGNQNVESAENILGKCEIFSFFIPALIANFLV